MGKSSRPPGTRLPSPAGAGKSAQFPPPRAGEISTIPSPLARENSAQFPPPRAGEISAIPSPLAREISTIPSPACGGNQHNSLPRLRGRVRVGVSDRRQPLLRRVEDELSPVPEVKLLNHVIHMVSHRLGRDRACAGDLLGAPPARDPHEDLAFAQAEGGRSTTFPSPLAGEGQGGGRSTISPPPLAGEGQGGGRV